MKRCISTLIILAVILSFTACKTQDEEMSAVNDEIVENTPTDDTTQTPSQNQPTQDVATDNKQEQPVNKEEPKPDTPAQTVPDTQPNTEVTQKPQTSVTVEPEEKVPDYKSMSCKSSLGIGWKQVRLYNASKKSAVQIELPESWTLNANGAGGYDVMSGGSKIGVISTAAPTAPKGKYDSTNYYNKEKKIFTFMDVYWYKDDGTDRIERYYQFVCDESNFTVNMNIDYTELDSTAVSKIKESAISIIEQPNISLEKLENANGSKKILIIGNSFVGTSQVGAFLNNMLSGSGYSVEAISRGHATVKTYADDSALLARIKNGEFAYVFQCGFYAEENAAALETVKNSCATSDTNLVIFPAHNETPATINAAKLQYTDLYFLDWKSEIIALIDSGVDRWDLCINDQYKHSTTLAGYVGAHMIYSNLFKKVPPAITDGAPLSMNEVKSKLGDYPERSVSIIHQSSQLVEFSGTQYNIA